jgi:hypothetical protein
VSRWLSVSNRVRLASQLVSEFENQFWTGQYKAVLRQFGTESERSLTSELCLCPLWLTRAPYPHDLRGAVRYVERSESTLIDRTAR